jgi:hypothetical protein
VGGSTVDTAPPLELQAASSSPPSANSVQPSLACVCAKGFMLAH